MSEVKKSMHAQQTIVLPSGLPVLLMKYDPQRPWEVWGTGNGCVVRRQRKGDSTRFEEFRGGRSLPLALSQEDAAVLVDRLNANVGLRTPRAAPTAWR